MMRRKMATVMAAALLAAGTAMAADPFPNKPIRMVIGFSAGGTTDILARLMATDMARTLGQPVVIENKPGASGTIGADFVAKAVPDGHTIMFTTSSVHGVAPSLFKKLPYDSVRDFAPIALVSRSTMVLTANNDFAPRTVRDVIALAKNKPGTINYASAGPGSTFHLVAALFSKQAGIEMQHIPYKGGGTAMPGVMAGDVQLAFDNIASTRTLIDGHKVRAMAVTSKERSPSLPDVPTFAEAGLPGFVLYSWGGLVAPAGTPPDVIARLNSAANKALQTVEVREAFRKGDTEPQGGTPQEFAAFMADEQKKWGEAVRISGATLE